MNAASTTVESHESAGRGPWWWVPTLYFAEGVPYVVVMTVAVIMFKRLGVGNAQIALYTSWLYLPYAIKPLWSPLVQRIGTRRSWVLAMQLLIAAGLACVAFAIPLYSFLLWSLVALAVTAISSATHDVAADGFYLLALSSHEQAWFVGIRNIAYRMATIFGTGLLVILAGALESSTGLPTAEVVVRAGDTEPAVVQFNPNAVSPPNDANAQRLSPDKTLYEMSFHGRDTSDADRIKKAVREWNVAHGFYSAPEASRSGEKSGWVLKLEALIRRWFGPEGLEKSSRGGDLAIVLIRLTTAVGPGEQQVVQFGHSTGDSNFLVAEGERFVVTEANWNQPFAAVVQVDAKLDRSAEATFEIRSGNLPLAWSVTFFVVAATFLLLCGYHFVAMPRPAADALATSASHTSSGLSAFVEPFIDFFRKPRIVAILAFLLLYRFPEAQLVKLTQPFLLDSREAGGLALSTGTVGTIYGIVGVAMLLAGGVIGGLIVARDGLGRWLWPMALAMHLPNLAFLLLAYMQPADKWVITAGVAVEQFGYGFGFTAFMLYCLYVATDRHETVHYAICTGLMAFGMMIPGMWSGWLQELIGYRHFYIWIMLAMIPSLLSVAMIRFDPTFGKKSAGELAGKDE